MYSSQLETRAGLPCLLWWAVLTSYLKQLCSCSTLQLPQPPHGSNWPAYERGAGLHSCAIAQAGCPPSSVLTKLRWRMQPAGVGSYHPPFSLLHKSACPNCLASFAPLSSGSPLPLALSHHCNNILMPSSKNVLPSNFPTKLLAQLCLSSLGSISWSLSPLFCSVFHSDFNF